MMMEHTPPRGQLFFVLEMKGHGLALRSDFVHGGINHRYLNVNGRWSASSTPAVPLIVWQSHDEASAAADIASKARSRQIKVSSRSADSRTPFKAFDQTLGAALLGYLPYGATAARKLEERRLKLMHNANAVLAVANISDETAAAVAGRQASSNLRKIYGGGSVVSAMQYLSGNDAAEMLVRVLDGELKCSEGQTPERLLQAMALALAGLNFSASSSA